MPICVPCLAANVVVLALAVLGPAGEAAPPGPALRWEAPEGCPEQQVVEALVAQHRQGIVASPRTDDVVDAHVTAMPDGGWQLAIVIESSDGRRRRTLELRSCEAAAEATALVVALGAYPEQPWDSGASGPATDDAGKVPPPPIPSGAPSSPGAPATADTDPQPRPSSASQEALAPTASRSASTEGPARTVRKGTRRPRGFVGLGGGVGFGVFPQPGGQLALHGGVLGRRWLVEARADHWLRRKVRLDAMDTTGGNLSISSGGVSVGIRLAMGPVEASLGPGIELGVIRSRGVGATHNYTKHVFWAAATAAGGLAWAPIPQLAVGIRAELVVPLVRHTFTIEGSDGLPLEVNRTGPVGGRVLARVEARFP